MSPARATGTGEDLILEAAKRLFGRRGYARVSASDIAREAGVSKANVFHHFGTKEALYLAVLKVACDETMGSIEGDAYDDPAVALRVFFASQREAMLRHPEATRLILREIVEGGGQRARPMAEQVFAGHFSRLVALVASGQAAGALRRDFDPALLAYLLLGANVFFFENKRRKK